MKKKQEGLSSLVAQVSHLGLFLEQNSAVMKEAKRKSKEMNREEKENILSLNKKEWYLLFPNAFSENYVIDDSSMLNIDKDGGTCLWPAVWPSMGRDGSAIST